MSRKFYSWGASGQVEGTGSVISIALDFKPRRVILHNIDGDARLEWYEDMGAGKGMKLIEKTPAGSVAAPVFTGAALTTEAIVVKDDDNAASTGVAVYLYTKDGITGNFQFVSPTNADGQYTLNNGGGKGFILDLDAAATDAVAIYFDEDAANADERFLCVSPSAQDILVPVNANKSIRVKHDASAASNGVQVYFDEDATNSYERLMFVSPTNANGAGATDDTYRPMDQLAAGTNSAPAFTGSAPGFLSEISSGGITVTGHGFSIGTDSDVNVSAETIHWKAFRD